MTNKLAKMGFTLIELLVVVLIIGILAAVALPQYNKAVLKSRITEAKLMFNAMEKALNLYLMENEPTTYKVISPADTDIETSWKCSAGFCTSPSGAWKLGNLSVYNGGWSIYMNNNFRTSTQVISGEVELWAVYDNSTHTTTYQCHAVDEKGVEICKVFASGDARWTIDLGSLG